MPSSTASSPRSTLWNELWEGPNTEKRKEGSRPREGLDFGPLWGWVWGRYGAGALELDSRGACAPLDAGVNTCCVRIMHHDVLRRTHKQACQTSAPDSNVTTTPHQQCAQTTSFCTGSRTHHDSHAHCTAACTHMTPYEHAMQGGLCASAGQPYTWLAQQPLCAPGGAQRAPTSLTYVCGASRTSGSQKYSTYSKMVMQRAELQRRTCASKVGGQQSGGQMGGREGASKAPSKGLSVGRRERLTGLASASRTSRKGAKRGGRASQRRRGFFAFLPRAVLHSVRFIRPHPVVQ